LTGAPTLSEYNKVMLAETANAGAGSAGATVVAGSATRLREQGRLLTKVGRLPVVVFWHEGRARAVEDRCPHMGFPLHRGTVEAGLVTCHWHHARFDLESGCTLDLWADDARAFDVDIVGDDVLVAPRPNGDEIGRFHERLREGLEEGLTLVVAKAVLGLLDHGVAAGPIVRTGVRFGATYRGAGWGAGLTVLVAMANVLDRLDGPDRAAALVHALAFVSRDTRGHPPRFQMGPLRTDEVELERLAEWYRRFVDTRSTDAAERVLVTALASPVPLDDVERMMLAAVTDHVFVDGGHTLDFTNKAFEAVDLLGEDIGPLVLPTLVDQTANAGRSEEGGAWRHPHDLAALIDQAEARLPHAIAAGGADETAELDDVGGLAHALLVDDPDAVVDAVLGAIESGASPEQLGRALAYAAALRITRFHTQNDFGDWDSVHHAFTAANALHRSLERAPSPELLRGVVHGSSTCLPPGSQVRPRAISTSWPTAGRSRTRSTAPATSPTAIWSGAERGRRWWPHSAMRSSARTPSSTGSRCTRRPSARRSLGPRDPTRPPSSSPGSHASSLPTRRRGASCPASSTSPPACVGETTSSRRPPTRRVPHDARLERVRGPPVDFIPWVSALETCRVGRACRFRARARR